MTSSRIELTLQIFGDGGWFVPAAPAPAPAISLSPIYLTEPTVQITTDGTTWTTVAATSNYVATYDGYQLPRPAHKWHNTALSTLATSRFGSSAEFRLVWTLREAVACAGFPRFLRNRREG
jgi:hypothetical protein